MGENPLNRSAQAYICTQDIVCAIGNNGINDNHSIAYCLLGYLCAYYRCYYPVEFITSFLNNAANDEDIANGTALAIERGIKIVSPQFGLSRGEYFFNTQSKVIAKGVASLKYMSQTAADELYTLSQNHTYTTFTDLLYAIKTQTSLDARQFDILIKIDFFSRFGNQRELQRIVDLFSMFGDGQASQIKKEKVAGTELEPIVARHGNAKTKTGKDAKSYTALDTPAILRECEAKIKSSSFEDIDIVTKAMNFHDIMGYAGYVSGRDEDRAKLLIKAVYPARRKKDNVLFGYIVLTHSLGSGKESRMTIPSARYKEDPIQAGDIIVCRMWKQEGIYFKMYRYDHLHYHADSAKKNA